MNILSSPLPKKIRVNNIIYDINYDYRTIIRTLLAFEDDELTQEEKKKYQKIKDLVELEPVKKQSEARKKFFEEFHKIQK